jgi:hypothetical protein
VFLSMSHLSQRKEVKNGTFVAKTSLNLEVGLDPLFSC